jgi:hypothetical protein
MMVYLVSLGDPLMVKLLKDNFMGFAHNFLLLFRAIEEAQTLIKAKNFSFS